MIRTPPRSTRTDTLFPYTTLFRSPRCLLALVEQADHRQHNAASRHARADTRVAPEVGIECGMNTQRAIEIAFPAHKAPFEVGHRPRGPLDRQAVRIAIVPDRPTLRPLRGHRGPGRETTSER